MAAPLKLTLSVSRRRVALVSLVSSVGLATAACPRHTDYTPQIAVVPGAAKRIALIPSKAPRRDEAAKPARVHLLRPGEELGGPNAIGKPGDLVLENDEVVFVIDKLGTSAGFAESGGNLVDAADAIVRRDELGQLFTYFGAFPRQAVYDEVTSGQLPDGGAFVESKGRELYEPDVAVVTRYTLRGGDRALLIETTLESRADHAIEKLRLGDAIQWGGAEKFAPGKAVGFRGPSSGPFVGALGRTVSYAITSTDGAIEAVSGSSWTDTMQTGEIALTPRGRVHYARVFVVGQRGDSASIVSELGRVAGVDAGEVEIALVDEASAPVAAPEGAKVVLSLPSGAEVLSIARGLGGAGARFAGHVPTGKYRVAYAGGGGRRGLAGAEVDVVAGGAARATLKVSAAGRLSLRCVEAIGPGSPRPLPCKFTLEGLAGTSAPDFGPAHVAGPARHQITTDARGAAEVALAPGRYRVTASRGPEYALAQFEEVLEPGKEIDRTLELRRVVDTRGYVATDFHQHTMIGADAPVGVRDRVIANAAEGVEVAVASEHNVVVDLEPLVREMALDTFLVEIAGNELTTDASKRPWGHVNVFPLAPSREKARGGASLVRDREAHDVFAELRAGGEPKVIQINHPRTGTTGYFDQLKFDSKTGVGSDPAYDPGFDALEVWNGRNVEARERVLADYFALLRTGHPVTPTADTDTHGIVGQEAGYPRTYVGVAADDELASWDAARTRDLVEGVRVRRDVVLTNGPFMRVRVASGGDARDGAPPGGFVRARSRRVTVSVHVECAAWVDVTRVLIVRVVADGSPGAARASAKVALKPLAGGPIGAVGADVVRQVDVAADDAIVVIASGERPLAPVLGGDEKEIVPFAMSGAIWVDADGDGVALGRPSPSLPARTVGNKAP